MCFDILITRTTTEDGRRRKRDDADLLILWMCFVLAADHDKVAQLVCLVVGESKIEVHYSVKHDSSGLGARTSVTVYSS